MVQSVRTSFQKLSQTHDEDLMINPVIFEKNSTKLYILELSCYITEYDVFLSKNEEFRDLYAYETNDLIPESLTPFYFKRHYKKEGLKTIVNNMTFYSVSLDNDIKQSKYIIFTDKKGKFLYSMDSIEFVQNFDIIHEEFINNKQLPYDTIETLKLL